MQLEYIDVGPEGQRKLVVVVVVAAVSEQHTFHCPCHGRPQRDIVAAEQQAFHRRTAAEVAAEYDDNMAAAEEQTAAADNPTAAHLHTGVPEFAAVA